MARRVNTKFIVLLLVVLAGLGAAMIGVWYIAGQRSAMASLREADEAMAAKDYLMATKRYSKAATHRENSQNIEMMIRASNANSLVPVSSGRDGNYYLSMQIAWLRRAMRLNPHDQRALKLLMNLRMRLAVEMDSSSEWDSIYEQTQDLLRSYPNLDLAIKYRAISQVNRIAMASAITPTAADRQQITDDLQATIIPEENPDDVRHIKHLARWNLLEAEFLDELGGDPEQADVLRSAAAALTGKALEKQPEDVDRLIDHLFILLQLNNDVKATPFVKRLQERLIEKPTPPPTTARGIQLILQHKLRIAKRENRRRLAPEALKECERITRTAIKSHPNSVILAYTLGTLLRDQAMEDEALTLFDDTWNASYEAPSFKYLRSRIYRMVCGISSLEIWANRLDSIGEKQQRKKTLDEMESKLKVILSEYGERPGLTTLAGRISYARRDFIDAAKKFEDAVVRGANDLRTMMESAETHMRLKEWGAATNRFEIVVAKWPHATSARYALAELYIRQMMYDKADAHLKEITHGDRDGDRHQRIRVEVLLGQGNFDEADELLSKMNVADNPKFSIRAAIEYIRADRNDSAIRLLEDAFDEHPSNYRVLSTLLDATSDKKKKDAYIDRGEEAGINAESIDRLRRWVRGEFDFASEFDALLKERIKNQKDPALQAVQWYTYHKRQGDIERAREELRKVADEDLDSPAVIEAMFVDALMRKEFDEAGSIVARARVAKDGRGIDLAKGAFYQARLKMAQGRDDQAVVALREGLKIRKVYSTGWEMLGSILIRTAEYRSAIEAFQTALKHRPTSSRVLQGLSTAYHRIGDSKSAARALRTMYKYHSRNYVRADTYLRYEHEFGSPERALKGREQIAVKTPGNLNNIRAMAMTLSKLKRFDEAKEKIDEVIDKAGLTLSNVISKSLILHQAEETEEAVEELQDYIQSKQTDLVSEDYFRVARQLHAMGQTNAAISTYRQAAAIEGPYQPLATTELAQILMKRADRVEEAIQLYREIAKSNPQSLQASLTYARALLQQEKIDAADEVLQTSLTQHDPTVQTLMIEGQIATMRGQTDDAVSYLDAAIELQPKQAILYLIKAELLSKDSENHGNALAVLDDALELDPRLDDARQLRATIHRARKDYQAAIAELETILERSPKRPITRKELSVLYMESGHHRKFDDLLEASAKLFPNDPYWPWHQAQRAKTMNRIALAIEKMKVAFELDETKENLIALVSMLLATNAPDAAMRMLDDNATMLADSPILTMLRGQTMIKTTGRAEALEVFSKALMKTKKYGHFQRVRNEILRSLDPETTRNLILSTFGESMPVLVRLGVADLDMSSGDHEMALERLRPLAASIGDHRLEEQNWFYHVYGLSLHQTGRYAEAAATYRAHLKLGPENIVVKNNLAYLLVDNLDKPDEAVLIMQEAVKRRPNDSRLLDTLGYALHKVGQHEEAAHILEQSAKLKPAVSTFLHLVDVMIDVKNTERAIYLLQMAEKLAERTNDPDMLELVNERQKALEQ